MVRQSPKLQDAIWQYGALPFHQTADVCPLISCILFPLSGLVFRKSAFGPQNGGLFCFWLPLNQTKKGTPKRDTPWLQPAIGFQATSDQSPPFWPFCPLRHRLIVGLRPGQILSQGLLPTPPGQPACSSGKSRVTHVAMCRKWVPKIQPW